ncbi:hypothetical protein B0J11DRAFT_186842 [Dendryphion nanum]|uniref:Uncharacterized protein n=1 Tax=Dendryphion nanum TaxID=256645 RepID=A0A9P9I8M8_9PLEO|nr:hypothetical protein B0J11DRAFT_186842 [Dendryphion nanum]
MVCRYLYDAILRDILSRRAFISALIADLASLLGLRFLSLASAKVADHTRGPPLLPGAGLDIITCRSLHSVHVTCYAFIFAQIRCLREQIFLWA